MSTFDLIHDPWLPCRERDGRMSEQGILLTLGRAHETAELSKLISDVPNGAPMFTTRIGGDLSVPYAEAARWLVHCQAFDPSGIKAGAVGDDRVKGGKGYPIGVAWSGLLGGVLLEGRTLKETLLLNLIAADFDVCGRDPAVDLPVWERPPVTAAEEAPGG